MDGKEWFCVIRKINDPKDYLSYSKEVLLSAGVLTAYPKLFTYYQELCVDFEDIYYDRTKNLFDTFRALLAVDAQIQILLELVTNTKTDLCQELGMKEEEIISMISMTNGTIIASLRVMQLTNYLNGDWFI